MNNEILLIISAVIFLLLGGGCSHFKKEVQSVKSSPYMSLEEIEADLEAPEEKSFFSDPDILEREKQLVPMDELLKGVENIAVDKGIYDIKSLPERVDLRQYDNKVVSQWNGTCTAHAAIAAVENLASQQGFDLKLSERHAWDLQQNIDAPLYSTYTAIKNLSLNYVGLDSEWPHAQRYVSKLPRGLVKIDSYFTIQSDVQKMKYYLANKIPVNLAMSTPSGMLSCSKTISPNSSFSSGGHALSIVGYFESEKYGTVAIIKNSWGRNCGDGGYQYLPMSLCFRPSGYCYMLPIAKIHIKNHNPEPDVDPKPIPTLPEDKKCIEWYLTFQNGRLIKKCSKWE